jgi:hypothetical protein
MLYEALIGNVRGMDARTECIWQLILIRAQIDALLGRQPCRNVHAGRQRRAEVPRRSCARQRDQEFHSRTIAGTYLEYRNTRLSNSLTDVFHLGASLTIQKDPGFRLAQPRKLTDDVWQQNLSFELMLISHQVFGSIPI